MHIQDGILSAPVLIAGAGLAAAGTAVGLRKINADNLPRVGLMAAVFFVGSTLTRVPTSGASSAHLLLNGLAGLLLGWAAFPALLVGLFLQAVLFGFGGVTTLGVNTVVMALPAVVVYLLLGPLVSRKGALSATACFAAGAGGVLLAAILYSAALFLSGEAFWAIAGATFLVHLPVIVVEGVVCAFCVKFLGRVRPQMLSHSRREVIGDR